MFGIPHFHSDLQWWKSEERYAEDIEKILEKALVFLEKNRDFKYTIDQVTSFKPFVESEQERMDKVSKYVDEGRIELVGGTWAAPDENIPTGEAIIRQFLYGKDYVKKNFGEDLDVAWEIDEFGHPYQLPQILSKCGFKYFAFSRGVQPWNAGHDLDFYWEAPDGSKILTHWFAGSYTGVTGLLPLSSLSSTGRMVGEMENRMKYEGERSKTDKLMVPFGTDFSEPMEEWLDFREFWNSEREEKMDFATPSDFFEEVEEKDLENVGCKEFNPMFTGCYESREKIKKNCRKTQNKIIEAEKFATIAHLLGDNYPQDKLESAWKYILKNDSHDTICGTETDRVYREVSLKRYEIAENLIDEVRENSLEFVTEEIGTDEEGAPVAVFNSLNWERVDIVSVDLELENEVEVRDESGETVPSQIKKDEVYFRAKVPAMGYRVFYLIPKEKEKQETDLAGDTSFLENKYYRLEIDKNSGCIDSLYDKELEEEILSTDGYLGNEIVMNEDVGNLWTVHELGEKLRSSDYRAEINLIEDGPLVKTIEVKGAGEELSWEQKISIYSEMRRIDFETIIQFEGKDKRVKVSFNPNIQGKNYFETPFYTAERKDGHWPVQNWVDVSNKDKGFGLINTGNPGYEVEDGRIFMTLFRSVSVLPFRLPEFILKNFKDLVNKLKTALRLSLKGLYLGEWVLYPYHGLMLREYASEGGPEPEGGWSLIDHLLPWLTSWKEADAWERGEHSFRYSIYPHKGSWKDAEMPRRGYEVNNPLNVKRIQNEEGELPEKYSFLQLEEKGVILSALKKALGKEGLVARFYETMGDNKKIEFSFSGEIEAVSSSSMIEEETNEELDFSENSLEMEVKGNEIKTIYLKPKK